jgi:hypothetical protein
MSEKKLSQIAEEILKQFDGLAVHDCVSVLNAVHLVIMKEEPRIYHHCPQKQEG